MTREEFPVEDSQQKKEEKSNKQSGEEELPALIKSKDDEIIEQAQTILKSLSLASAREELEKADELLNTLIKFVDQNPLNYELYYLLIEGFNTVLNGQFKNGRADFIVELTEKLVTYMYHNLNIDEHLLYLLQYKSFHHLDSFLFHNLLLLQEKNLTNQPKPFLKHYNLPIVKLQNHLLLGCFPLT